MALPISFLPRLVAFVFGKRATALFLQFFSLFFFAVSILMELY